MNKNLILIVVTAFLFGMSYTAFSQGISIGAKGGINLASAALKDINTNGDYIVGFNTAIPFEIGISKAFAIQPELAFSKKGYGTDYGIIGSSTYKLIFTYMEIPVLFKGGIGGDALKVNFFAGPSIGFAISGKEVAKAGGQKFSEKIDLSSSIFNRLNAEMVFGTEFQKLLGNGHLFLDLRYQLGFTDIWKVDSFSAFHRSIGMGLGYKHRLTSGS